MSGHEHCCKGRKRPTTAAQFAALLFPSNPHHDENKNRVHNPVEVGVDYTKVEAGRKGWWFELKASTSGPPLLDGSGDGKPRGFIYSSAGVVAQANPATKSWYRLVCLNAASLKLLRVPGASKRQLCGFTWRATLLKAGQPIPPPGRPPPAPDKPPPPGGFNAAEQAALASGSGWIPISAIDFKKKKAKETVLAALESWKCCTEKYRDWGHELTRKGKRYRFRTAEEVTKEIVSFAAKPKRFDLYFKDINGKVRSTLVASQGVGLSSKFGILASCKRANKLTDYLPKGSDHKDGGYDRGYTNLCANVSIGPRSPRMAPIALDIFPAGHIFQRMEFKGKKQIWGYIFKVPESGPVNRKPIGRVQWFYGYCDAMGSKKERRYGWVPALALKRA